MLISVDEEEILTGLNNFYVHCSSIYLYTIPKHNFDTHENKEL